MFKPISPSLYLVTLEVKIYDSMYFVQPTNTWPSKHCYGDIIVDNIAGVPQGFERESLFFLIYVIN